MRHQRHGQHCFDNTVTVSGTAPGNVPVTSNDTENVDVIDALPTVSVVKTYTFAPGGDVNSNGLYDAGDTIAYTYTVTNAGNVTLTNVKVTDAHDGVGTAPVIVVPVSVTTDAGAAGDSTDTVPADDNWGTLGPQDVITFTSTYTVVNGDITGAGGGSGPSEPDGSINNTATVTSDFGATPVSSTDAVALPLNILPSLQVSKVASDTTNVAVGDVITYTYTVTNNGNVPITNVTLSDTHKGVVGALTPTFSSWTTQNGSTITGNNINTLEPGSVAVFTATYTVTQNDVDTLQ